MLKHALTVYNHLPAPARSLAASMRGWYLRSWRYGPETDALVEAALERDHWSPSQWKSYQEDRLAYILHRAATRVPYYREHWQERQRNGDNASWEYLENWPILEKEPLRINPQAFVADDCDVRRMFHEHTSGTTGKSLDLWWSRRMVREWYALFEARWRRWYGISRHDPWAILGGQLVTPVTQKQPPFWAWNAGLNQLYLSSYHLAPELIPHYLDALTRYRIRYLWGYTSALYELALGALDANRDDLRFEVIITNAEPVTCNQRAIIETAFHSPLRETYGMAEAVAAASECEAGSLHSWPEAGWIEILNGSVTQSFSGELLCTGLLNEDMPLIRYKTGDTGTLHPNDHHCNCGRLLPRIESIEGRSDDVLYSVEGRRIGRLDPVFKSRLPVKEAQIIQETLERFVVRYVPADGFSQADEASIRERLIARVGPAEVVLEPVNQIPRGPNGKFRAVVCKLPRQVIQEIEDREAASPVT